MPGSETLSENKGLESSAERASQHVMEARVAVLEQIAKNTEKILDRIDARLIRMEDRQTSDFRILFGANITVALGLAGLMAHGFHWF